MTKMLIGHILIRRPILFLIDLCGYDYSDARTLITHKILFFLILVYQYSLIIFDP